MSEAASETTTTETTQPETIREAKRNDQAEAARAVQHEAYQRALAAIGDSEDSGGSTAETEGEGTEDKTAEEPDKTEAEETQTDEETGDDGEAETTAEEQEKPPPPSAARWAALSQAEQRIARERAQLEEQQTRAKAEMEQQQAQWGKQLAALKALREGKAAEGLRELGVDYNQLTAQMLAGGQAPPDIKPALEPLQQQIEEMQEKLAASEKARAEQEAAAAQMQVQQQIRTQLEGGRAERWELLHASGYDAGREVQDLIRIEWERAGKPVDATGQPMGVLTVEAAADRLESYLADDLKRRLTTGKAKKLLGSNGSEADTKQPQQAEKGQPRQRGAKPVAAKTLTNQHGAEVARVAPTGDPAECRRRALAVMESMD